MTANTKWPGVRANHLRYWIGILAIMIFGLIIRLPFAEFAPIHDDSSVYYSIAAQLAAGSFVFTGHLVVEMVMAIFVFIFGRAGANIASLTAAVLTIPVVGATGTALFSSRRAGLGAAIVIAGTPLHIYFSSWAYTDPIAVLGFSLALFSIVRGRYRRGLALTGLVVLMRVEYALLILVPLMLLRVCDSGRIRYLIVSVPVIGNIILTLLSSINSAETSGQLPLIDLLNTPLYSIGFLSNLTESPLRHLSSNSLFYTVHFLHWGVPYWELALLNPLLPALFVIGAYSLLPRIRASALAVGYASTALAVAFAVRELVGVDSQLVGALLLLFLISGFCLLFAAGPIALPEFQPLFALIPYTMLLLVLYLAPRYLLPMVVVGALYAGLGIVKAYDAVMAGDRWTIHVHAPV